MIKIDMHVHTHFSKDSFNTLEDIEKACQRKGIDGLVVCDHNEINGALFLKERSKLKVIVGEEINTEEGEVIGLFLKNKIQPFLKLEETIREIKAQCGLVYIPHPFDRLRKSKINLEALNRIIKDVDIIEGYNSRNVFNKDNRIAYEFALKKSKPIGAGSDAHTKREVGSSYIEINSFDNAQEFLRNLKSATLVHNTSSIHVHLITKIVKKLKQNNSKFKTNDKNAKL